MAENETITLADDENISVTLAGDENTSVILTDDEKLALSMKTFQLVGVDDYNALSNIPKINGVEVKGEKSLDDYDIKKKSEATEEHTQISNLISAEVTRAQAAEKVNADAIAELKESSDAGALNKEIERAKAAEKVNADAINAEATRAQAAEKTNADAISSETTRATAAEQTNAEAISAETTRAKAAEKTNADAIADETTRSKAAEQTNADAISSHTSNTNNPHSVTKTQIGLGNVDNISFTNILKAVYPIGSIYISTVYKSPGVLFGFGTWIPITNKFLLSAGSNYTAGNTGGSSTHSHKYGLKYGEYYGAITGHVLPLKDGTNTSTNVSTAILGNKSMNVNGATTTSQSSKSLNELYAYTDTSSESSLPPYLVVYMWQRTA